MGFTRRRLPHLSAPARPLFITWRLFDSLPSDRRFPGGTLTSGKAFVAMDRLLDLPDCGRLYLTQAAIAEVVVNAIHYNAEQLRHYELHAYAVMPNHVHLLITPLVEPARLLRSLKGITAKRANELLECTGRAFWQDESYDHVVRNGLEFERIRSYIERNPVTAGLVSIPEEFRWSSAWRAGGPAADQGVRPTIGFATGSNSSGNSGNSNSSSSGNSQ
jgi:REP element-mobilizing transposase RayT